MLFDLVIANVTTEEATGLIDIGILNGKIAALEPDLNSSGNRYDGCGCFAFPGFVDCHIHLDKAGILHRCQICEGTLPEAVRETAKAKGAFTEDDVYQRASAVVERAIMFGTNVMRTFVEIDPRAGFRSFEAIKKVREDYRWAIDLQICAFAQEGLTQEPETLGMLDAALANGADLIGGCPYTDPNPATHIRQIFDLAQKYDVDVDFHLDFDLIPEGSNLGIVIEETIKRDYQHRVSVGHVTKLSAMPSETVTGIAGRLSAAAISLTTLPATDMFLLGRDRDHLIPRGIAPAMLLTAHGVNVTIATNNVMNPFTPFGDASLVRMANLFANAAQISKDEDILATFHMVSDKAARLMRRDYGIKIGAPANIVLLDADNPLSAVRGLHQPLAGWKNGRQTFARPKPSLLR